MSYPYAIAARSTLRIGFQQPGDARVWRHAPRRYRRWHPGSRIARGHQFKILDGLHRWRGLWSREVRPRYRQRPAAPAHLSGPWQRYAPYTRRLTSVGNSGRVAYHPVPAARQLLELHEAGRVEFLNVSTLCSTANRFHRRKIR